MAKLYIEGGKRLTGSVDIHGAKNSALPILAASLLVSGESILHNCPNLSDVDTTLEILKSLGCKVTREGHSVIIDSQNVTGTAVDAAYMQKMRSSVIFIGALLARCKKASVSLPGGCELGPRPIDIHLAAFRRMGAEIDDKNGKIECYGDNIYGCELDLPFPSVGATENIMLCAALNNGETVIHNAAREPEIVDLANFLNECGAKIYGAGESNIVIDGVSGLHGAEHSIIPDRIEAATFMSAAAITGSDLTLKNIVAEHIQPVMYAFREAGCTFGVTQNELCIHSPKILRRVECVRTLVYPGFPTDALLPFIAMQTVADGTSMFIETIFQNRFKQISDLNKMGAHIKTEERVAVVDGVKNLYAASVNATDLRGGAALVTAALKADGITEIGDIHHIERGYENIDETLISLGASAIIK